ncbi:hypothetical protein GCM10009577_39700 [Streptomyces javensis]
MRARWYACGGLFPYPPLPTTGAPPQTPAGALIAVTVGSHIGRAARRPAIRHPAAPPATSPPVQVLTATTANPSPPGPGAEPQLREGAGRGNTLRVRCPR